MGNCKGCRWWRPDYFFDDLGECEKKPGIHREDEAACEMFEVKKENEFCWCRDCKVTFHASERGLHRGHNFFCRTRVDPDVHEYTSTGD